MARTHQELEERSLAMHRLVAEKIRRDPRLLEVVRSNISRWRPTLSAATLPYVDRWAQLLDVGLDALLESATEDSERARTLRQSSPFAGVLSEEERLAFLATWKRTHDPRGA